MMEKQVNCKQLGGFPNMEPERTEIARQAVSSVIQTRRWEVSVGGNVDTIDQDLAKVQTGEDDLLMGNWRTRRELASWPSGFFT